MAFRFKQFTVEDDQSTMKIGTDAILLGAWAETGNAGSILEIGTGCGVISLMLAQKSDAGITAIDIDNPSVIQASTNFSQSPWSDRLHSLTVSLQEYSKDAHKKFDLIITNPPYFTNSLKSPDPRKNTTRHTTLLSPFDLVAGVLRLMNPDGSFLIILPAFSYPEFLSFAAHNGLHLQDMLGIRPKKSKSVNRVLARFGFTHVTTAAGKELVIRNEDNSFSQEYLDFTAAYYFSLP
jgi:tRNA1Val (adenine37-N6)-methyltransferase